MYDTLNWNIVYSLIKKTKENNNGWDIYTYIKDICIYMYIWTKKKGFENIEYYVLEKKRRKMKRNIQKKKQKQQPLVSLTENWRITPTNKHSFFLLCFYFHLYNTSTFHSNITGGTKYPGFYIYVALIMINAKCIV